jgi:autotransporter-associated beta strand protein
MKKATGNIILLVTGLCFAAQAASDSWKTDAAGNWNAAANWTDGNVPGSTTLTNSTDVATLAVTLTTNRVVTVDNNRNIGGLTFANPANVPAGNAATNVGYTLSSGSLKLSNGGVIQVNNSSGTNTTAVDSDITIQGNGGSATFKNDASGEKAGLIIFGAVYGNSTTGNTTTLYLDGVSTSSGIGGSTRNNQTGTIGDGSNGGKLKLVKNGTGLWTISKGTGSTFTGGFYFNEGTIRSFGGGVGQYGYGTVTIGTNVTFSHGNATSMTITNSMVVNGNFTMDGSANTTWSGPINLGSATRTITMSAGTNNVFSGVISGLGGLTKAGGNDLILSSSNTYSGVTTVSQGELIANADYALGTNSVTVAGGATLTLTNGTANNYIGDQAKLILGATSTLNLNFSGAADTIDSLSLDGGTTWLPAGTYTAAALGATGSGSLIVATDGPAPVMPSDDFSGTPGTPLVGSSLDAGGSWANAQTDGGGSMNGNFLFAAGGGIIASNNGSPSAYTTFNASPYAKTFTNGFTLSITLTANGYTDGDLFLGLAETIDKGYFQNVATNDLIRFVYYLGGAKAGTFAWSVRDESVLLNNDDSTRAGTQTNNPTDVVRLSITVYPKFGLIFGVATNVTQNYLISKSRIGVNTPGLTNMLYAGMGWLNIATNSEVPAVISSFSITNAPDLTTAKPLSLSTTLPPVMTGFAFDDMTNGVANTNFAYILSEHASVDIMHAVKPTVYNTVRATYPDKIMIKQLAWGGTAGIPLGSIWPGHCLMKAGTRLTADVAATTNDTVLYLQDYTRIAASQANINNHADPDDADGYVLLYALDADGRPDWSRAEHVKLVSLNTTNGGITVQRAQHETTPLAFSNGYAAVARHMMFWNPSQWELNLSLESPRGGPFNMTAAEWFGLKVAQAIYANEADGVEMDVGRWQWGYPSSNPMDCDNDLAADYGYINGVCSFGLGGQVLQRTLRELLGPDRIVQTDGNDALFGQRGWKYMNGVQLESFPTGGYDIYSERFRHFRQWVSSVDTQPAFSYAFTKTPTTLFGHIVDTNNNNASYDWRFRVGFAAGLLTGMPHPFASVTDINFDPANPDYNDPNMQEDKGFYKWDEYVGGDLNDWKWLGAPLGPAIQITNNVGSTNLLASAVWQWKTESGFVSSCSITNGEYSAVITAIPSNTLPWTSTNYPGTQVPKAFWFGTRLEISNGAPVLVTNQEYTLEFEAKGNESWTVHGEVFDRVPRSLTIDGVSSNGYHKPASVFLGTNWTFYRFSIIADSNTPPPLVFGVSEQIGEASIRNIRLYTGGSERWMREFTNGRLYLNMTLTPWTVDVGTGVVQRLVGTQIPELNNGATENGMLTIPVWDAVYLRTWTVDAWKSAYFTTNELTNSAVSGDAADPDGDGFSNLQEYTAGTNPTNAASKFLLGGFNRAESKDVLNWSAVSGRVYEVYWTTNLLNSFVPLQTNIAWPQAAYTNSAPDGTESGFYKLKVRRR